jgi:hypothetical protein
MSDTRRPAALTPRITHAIDLQTTARHEDLTSLGVAGLLLAALRDQAVPLSPVPRADLPGRRPARPVRPTPPAGPSPLPRSLPIEPAEDTRAEWQADGTDC